MTAPILSANGRVRTAASLEEAAETAQLAEGRLVSLHREPCPYCGQVHGRTPGQLWEREAERDAHTGLRRPAAETTAVLKGYTLREVRGPLACGSTWYAGDGTVTVKRHPAAAGVIRACTHPEQGWRGEFTGRDIDGRQQVTWWCGGCGDEIGTEARR